MRKTAANIFTGVMDSDSDPRAIAPGNYAYAMNILNGSATKPGAAVSMMGTELQDYTLPAGLNICLGAIEDKVCGSLVYFVWNINENHRILRWFQNDGHVEEIAGGVKLNFDRYSRIQGFVLDGRLCYWIENKTDKDVITGNEPRKIDLAKASNYQKSYEYEWAVGFSGQGQFASGHEILFEVFDADGAPVDSQTVTFADDTYLNDVPGGLQYIYDELFDDIAAVSGPITVELCDCKLTITVEEPNGTLTVTSDTPSVLVPKNFFGPNLGDKETYHYALKKESPSCCPTPTFVSDPDIGYNNVRDGCFQFRTRFIYDDGGASHWSMASNIALNNAEFGEPQEYLNAIKVDYTDDRLNDVKWLTIIEAVEIAFRSDNDDVWKLIRRVPACEVGIGEQYIMFANDNLYSVVPSDDASVATGDTQVLTNYFRVPYRAGAIAPIAGEDGNVRLAFGAPQEGQTCPSCVNGFVEAVTYDNPDFVDIIGTVEIVNDPDASDTSINFPLYSSVDGGLDGFVVYLAGTNLYAISNNPADGSGDGSFRIKNVPRGQYTLRVASYACRYGSDLGSKYNLLAGTEWQETSSPMIEVAGSLAAHGLATERIVDLYGFVGAEFDLDTEVGFGTVQVQNYHKCPKTSNPSLRFNVFEFHFLDADGLYSSYAERLAGNSVENLDVNIYQGTGNLDNLVKNMRTDHNGYAWLLFDTANGTTNLRPVVASWGGDNTNGAQPYHLFDARLTGWNRITDETDPPDDRNDDESDYTVNNPVEIGGTGAAIQLSFVFNADPAWTTANQGTVRGTCTDLNGNPVSGVLLWMLTNGRTAVTNALGEYSLLVYAYDGLASRTAFQELRPVYLADIAGDFEPSPQSDATAFDIPAESPLEDIDFAFGFAGGIQSEARFLKSGGNYKIGIVYEDDMGRSPCGVTPFDTVRIPFHTQDGQYAPRQIQWTINSVPPFWATRFRIARTKDSFYQTYRHLPVSKVQYAKILENATFIQNVTYSSGEATHVLLAIRTQVPTDPNVVPTLRMFRDNIQNGYTSKLGDRCRYLLDETGATVFSDSLVEVNVAGDYIDGFDYWVVIPYSDIQREILPGWVFEFFTPKGFEEEIYWEVGKCYDLLVEPLRHSGDVQDQELGLTPLPAVGYVNSGDAYWRLEQFQLAGGDGLNIVTENETKNRYVQHKCEDIGRPFAVEDIVGEQFYTNRIRFSGLYVPSSNINDLSAFGALDYQSLNRTFGAIKWMGMVHTVLLAICQNKTQPVYVGKGRVIDLSGANIVGRADSILTIADETVADAGTLNPESVAVHDGRAYWWDLQRGTVWRYGGNGVQPINAGKVNYFRARHDERVNLDRNVDLVNGGIDRRHNMYHLSFGLEFYLGPEDELTPTIRDTVIFDIEKGGWSSHTEMHGQAYGAVNDEFCVFNNGNLYLAFKSSAHNIFFATEYDSYIKFAVNPDPQTMKDWLCLRVQADKQWFAPSVEILPTSSWPSGMASKIMPANMRLLEGMWKADFLRDMNDPHAVFVAIGDAATRQATAMLRGRPLKGDVALITLQTVNSDESNILLRVDVDYSDSQNTK